MEPTATTTTATTAPSPPTSVFEVFVSKETFKFNAAHFVAFPGFRERLHGHSYQIGVRLLGQRTIGADGYVLDFGCIKATCKKICKKLNERFLCPMYSDVLKMERSNNSIQIQTEDGALFVLPTTDCAMLPIVHATTEELAIYLWSEILFDLNVDYLVKRGIHTMEVIVAEAVGQEATFRWPIPSDGSVKVPLDVRTFIQQGQIVPMPCATDTESSTDVMEQTSGSVDLAEKQQKVEQTARAIYDVIATGSDVSLELLEELLRQNNM